MQWLWDPAWPHQRWLPSYSLGQRHRSEGQRELKARVQMTLWEGGHPGGHSHGRVISYCYLLPHSFWPVSGRFRALWLPTLLGGDRKREVNSHTGFLRLPLYKWRNQERQPWRTGSENVGEEERFFSQSPTQHPT